MKISNNDPNINTTSTAGNRDRRPVSDSDDSRKSSFSKTLERKREEREERDEDSAAAGKHEPQTATDAAPFLYSQGQQEAFGKFNFEAGGAASQAEGAHANIAALASEIVEQIRVEIAPGDVTSIEVDFNSKTLEGLKVRIESKDGKLGVHFTPPSEKVAALLSQNLATLNQNLTNHGYQVGVIDLKPMQAPRSEFEQRGRDSDGGERGGRQGGRDESDGGGSDDGGGRQQGGHER